MMEGNVLRRKLGSPFAATASPTSNFDFSLCLSFPSWRGEKSLGLKNGRHVTPENVSVSFFSLGSHGRHFQKYFLRCLQPADKPTPGLQLDFILFFCFLLKYKTSLASASSPLVPKGPPDCEDEVVVGPAAGGAFVRRIPARCRSSRGVA